MAVAPARSKPFVERLLLLCMVAGFAAVLIAGAVVVRELRRTARHQEAVTHTLEVEVAVAEARRLLEQAENVRRGYMISSDPVALQSYAQVSGSIGPTLDRLGALTRDNPTQVAALAELRLRMDAIVTYQRTTNALVSAGDVKEARAAFIAQNDHRPFVELRRLLDRVQGEERRLFALRDAEQRASERSFYLILGLAGALVLALSILSLVTVLRYTRDLNRSRGALQGLNDTLELQVAERTADLTRANEEIQRFAYIVSHDLRSPLVNVMGFTAELQAAAGPLGELVDRAEAEAPHLVTEDARLAVREDLPEAVGFIRTSTQKMDRLINAILQLSRQGRRVLTPEPLDLDALADGVVASIRHLIEERGAEVVVERPLPALTSDRVAVEQILSNLVENATKYLQPGRPGRITMSGRTERGRVMLAIADNGRGIAPADHGRIFDLFRRSGAQDQPGEGIGLAHVRALAYRLGGTVDVESELGRGSTFRVNLPATLETP